MNRTSLMLRLAGGLALFTCLGHTVGTFMAIPAEQVEVAKTVAVMKATLVPMPIGKPQNYADLFRGNNIAVSIYLLASAVSFFLLSGRAGLEGVGRKFLVLNSLSLLALSVVSALYFFPLPAACTGLAALLGLRVARSY